MGLFLVGVFLDGIFPCGSFLVGIFLVGVFLAGVFFTAWPLVRFPVEKKTKTKNYFLTHAPIKKMYVQVEIE